MPKIKIKNLSAEINRRIRLIKTSTSVVDIGEQNGAVVESADYVGICLSPFSEPSITCEGSVSSVELFGFLPIDVPSSPAPLMYIDGVLTDFSNKPEWLQLSDATSPDPVPPEGFYIQDRLKWTNTDTVNHTLEFVLEDEAIGRMLMIGTGVVEFVKWFKYGVCLLHGGGGTISCEDAVVSAYFGELIPEAMTQAEYNAINTDPDLQYVWTIDGVDGDFEVFSQYVNVEGILEPTEDQMIPIDRIPEGYKDAVRLGWATMTQVSNKTLDNHRIKIGYNKDVSLKPMFWANPTATENQACLAPKSTSLICTPDVASQSVELYQARQSLPFTHFGNVAFNIYENDVKIGSELALNSISDMSLVGLEVLFMDEFNRRVMISNRREPHRLIRLEPTTTSMLQDVDIVNGNAVIDGDSFYLCLAGGCEPTEFIMTDNNLFEGGSVRLDYVIDAPDHGISNVSKRFSMTDIAQGTYLSEIVRDVIAQIKEDHSFIAFREGTGNAVANFDYWTYRSTTDGLFRLSGITGVITNDPITIKFVKNNLNDDLFPLIFPGAASDGITEYSAHSCGTQDLPGI